MRPKSFAIPTSFAATSRLLLAVSLLGCGLMLTACNTTAGAGEDVSAAGHAITNSADKVKTGL